MSTSPKDITFSITLFYFIYRVEELQSFSFPVSQFLRFRSLAGRHFAEQTSRINMEDNLKISRLHSAHQQTEEQIFVLRQRASLYKIILITFNLCLGIFRPSRY